VQNEQKFVKLPKKTESSGAYSAITCKTRKENRVTTVTPSDNSPQPLEKSCFLSRCKFGRAACFLLPFIGLVLVLIPLLAVLSPNALTEDKIVIIPRGATVQNIAAELHENGVVDSPLVFRAMARVIASDNLQAGEYEFSPSMNMADIVVMMRDGRSIVRRFTVAEGLTSHEIVTLLRNDPTFSGDIPAIPPEGSLLPETYHYSYGDSRTELIERMQKGQRNLLEALWESRTEGLPLKTPEESIILASIVEKETGKKPEERSRVAGVFYNRLRQGIRLQSDPTVIYAITNGQSPLGRDLKHEDLVFISPFNTYVNAGLPPKPICNPGRASLEAVLQPENNDFLYFVADGTGGHAFAKDISQHNQNVARWLSLQKP